MSPEKVTPGPGTYVGVKDRYYSNIPGSKVGKDDRKSYFLRSQSYDKPEPGKYQTISFTQKSDAPKHSFSKAARERNYFNSFSAIPPAPN